MPSAKEIKSRIASIKDTQKITNAMYLISSTKLRPRATRSPPIGNFLSMITARGAQPISTKPAPSRMNIRETEPISRFMSVAKRNEMVLLKKSDPVQQKQGILPVGK